jgi:hypothetical protein
VRAVSPEALLAKAKALMAEVGHPNGLETVLSFDQGFATIKPLAAQSYRELAASSCASCWTLRLI